MPRSQVQEDTRTIDSGEGSGEWRLEHSQPHSDSLLNYSPLSTLNSLSPIPMRLRITFAKTEAMRYTGHLDLHRTWERTLRRAGLPLAYSQGFKPHPRIVLASALPLGCTSQCEVVDVWLEEQLPLEQINDTLKRAMPPGLQVLEVAEVDPALPALPTQLAASEFRI